MLLSTTGQRTGLANFGQDDVHLLDSVVVADEGNPLAVGGPHRFDKSNCLSSGREVTACTSAARVFRSLRAG
jgi:hypothetical protein